MENAIFGRKPAVYLLRRNQLSVIVDWGMTNLKDPKANACASSAPASVYGHTGFTGTCAWVDPENDLVYIFLSNRLCPDAWNGKLNSMKIRQAVQEVIYQSLYTPE